MMDGVVALPMILEFLHDELSGLADPVWRCRLMLCVTASARLNGAVTAITCVARLGVCKVRAHDCW